MNVNVRCFGRQAGCERLLFYSVERLRQMVAGTMVRIIVLMMFALVEGRQRARRRAADVEVEAAVEAEAAEAAKVGETIDGLGYYRFRWSPPTDACGTELHTDFDGTRVWNWGLDPSQHVATAGDCCAKCQAHPTCNSWVFCPKPRCFAPDAHRHTQGECWLKQQRDPAKPSVNMRERGH